MENSFYGPQIFFKKIWFKKIVYIFITNFYVKDK